MTPCCSCVESESKINSIEEWFIISIINHYGSFDGGHYTSIGKINTNKWIVYDDIRLSKIQTQHIKINYKTSAYLLLYEKIKQ